MSENRSAERFTERLMEHRSEEQEEQYRKYFKPGEGEYGEGDEFVGVRMGRVLELAKEFIEMLPDEIEIVTRKPRPRSTRGRALSIMGKRARRKKTPKRRREELFDLYRRRQGDRGARGDPPPVPRREVGRVFLWSVPEPHIRRRMKGEWSNG